MDTLDGEMKGPNNKEVNKTGDKDGMAPPLSPNKKQLPRIPDQDTQQVISNQMAKQQQIAPASSSHSNHGYGMFFLEYSLLAEYTQLQKQKLPGVYVIPSAKSALLWNGILFIRQGLYQGGVFRISLHIPENYPDGDCPRLFFTPSVFHPMIDADTGELDVKRAFTKWRRNTNHLWQVLLYARRVFYKVEMRNPPNADAALLYENNLEAYKGKISESIRIAKEQLYESNQSDDPHAIRFSPWDEAEHSQVKDEMLHPKVKAGASYK